MSEIDKRQNEKNQFHLSRDTEHGLQTVVATAQAVKNSFVANRHQIRVNRVKPTHIRRPSPAIPARSIHPTEKKAEAEYLNDEPEVPALAAAV